jgi:two-component system chemotaxis sensor kinase CheA
MDAFLRVLDEVNKMFDEVRRGVDPTPADPALLQSLIDMQNTDLNSDDSVGVISEVEAEPEIDEEETGLTSENAASDFVPSDVDITDDEFENLLDSLQKGKEPKSEPKKDTKPKAAESSNNSKSNNSDEISDDEFEALLDNLHGAGAGPKISADKKTIAKKETPAVSKSTANDDEMSDDEFESLLDDMHGKGNGPKILTDKKTTAKKETPVVSKSTANDDEMSDDEFESLLDDMHGKGNGPKILTDKKTTAKKETPVVSKSTANDDEMSDDEFESLLDDMHGKGIGPKILPDKKTTAKKETPAVSKSTANDNEMSDDEFESLLDDMHGKGKGPKVSEDKKETKSEKVEPAATKEPKPVKNPEESKAPTRAAAESAAQPSLAAQPKVEQSVTTVRVSTARLDEIMNLVGELVLARNRLNTLKDTFEDARMHKAISNLDVVTGDLQTSVMQTRMQPIKKVFGRFPRVVRDMARNLNKEISLVMKGEETDLDKNLVEALADPLVHLVRNSVDHGIEAPDIREAAGKAREGTIILEAQQEGDHILLLISDDGAGMDPEILRSKVVEKGLMDAESASRLDDTGCFDLIFMPGLSTKQEITDVSGRGVGMDVVKTKINQLNGMINIDSTLGKGTTLTIRVPLTLAILPTLMLQLGNRKFALPLSNVSEIFELNSKKVSVVDGRQVVLNRGKAPPIYYLRSWLLIEEDKTEFDLNKSQVIMVQMANTLVGLVVDHVIGQEEVVIKPLSAMLQGLSGIAGSTITGDGNIAIILDVQGLLKRFS